MLGAHNVAGVTRRDLSPHRRDAAVLALPRGRTPPRSFTIVTALAWSNDRFLLVTTLTFTDWRKTGDDLPHESGACSIGTDTGRHRQPLVQPVTHHPWWLHREPLQLVPLELVALASCLHVAPLSGRS